MQNKTAVNLALGAFATGIVAGWVLNKYTRTVGVGLAVATYVLYVHVATAAQLQCATLATLLPVRAVLVMLAPVVCRETRQQASAARQIYISLQSGWRAAFAW